MRMWSIGYEDREWVAFAGVIMVSEYLERGVRCLNGICLPC